MASCWPQVAAGGVSAEGPAGPGGQPGGSALAVAQGVGHDWGRHLHDVLASAIATAPALAAVIGAAGCGGVPGAASSQGDELTVYSSLPLQGPSGSISQQIVGGEKLALSDAGARVGPFRVSYALQDDSNPTSGRWEAGLTESDARTAADDPTTIAYSSAITTYGGDRGSRCR